MMCEAIKHFHHFTLLSIPAAGWVLLRDAEAIVNVPCKYDINYQRRNSLEATTAAAAVVVVAAITTVFTACKSLTVNNKPTKADDTGICVNESNPEHWRIRCTIV